MAVNIVAINFDNFYYFNAIIEMISKYKRLASFHVFITYFQSRPQYNNNIEHSLAPTINIYKIIIIFLCKKNNAY